MLGNPKKYVYLTVIILYFTEARHIRIRIQVNFKCTYVYIGTYSYRIKWYSIQLITSNYNS